MSDSSSASGSSLGTSHASGERPTDEACHRRYRSPDEIKRRFDQLAEETRALARDTSDIDETWRRIQARFDRVRGF